jgi:glycine cleavage system H protein
MKDTNERLYSTYHIWLNEFEECKFKIGITNYILDDMLTFESINLVEIGAHLKEGDVFGSLENSDTVYELTMPVDGEIIDVNFQIESNLDELEEDPLNNWLIKVKLADEYQIYELLNEKEYGEFVL